MMMLALTTAQVSAQSVFTKVVDPTNPVTTFTTAGIYKGASWVDFDNDGDVDLFAAPNRLFRNDGNGIFVQLIDLPFVPIQNPGGASFADLDQDGDQRHRGQRIAGLHAAAALFHHYFMRDDTLQRMMLLFRDAILGKTALVFADDSTAAPDAPGGAPIQMTIYDIQSGNGLVHWLISVPQGSNAVELPDLSGFPDDAMPPGPVSIAVYGANYDKFDYGKLLYRQLRYPGMSAYALDYFSSHLPQPAQP